jgi:sugar phosphate isomerase/epimerase
VKQCHIKDAHRPKSPVSWGEEVPAGTGQVDWKQFFAVLRERQFDGWCAIEREAGDQRVKDIMRAKQFVESLNR